MQTLLAEWAAHCELVYRCTPEQLDLHGGVGGAVARAYRRHVSNAEWRGIAWGFTLPDWWAVWNASGKWTQRGHGAQSYCMARIGDSGPYAPGNVVVATNRINAARHV